MVHKNVVRTNVGTNVCATSLCHCIGKSIDVCFLYLQVAFATLWCCDFVDLSFVDFFFPLQGNQNMHKKHNELSQQLRTFLFFETGPAPFCFYEYGRCLQERPAGLVMNCRAILIIFNNLREEEHFGIMQFGGGKVAIECQTS